MSTDLQPEVSDVLQEEPPAAAEPPVGVVVEGLVRVQGLPRKAGATRNITVGVFGAQTPTPSPVRLLRADKTRAKATVVSVGQNMLVGFDLASAQDLSTMMVWPANVPLVVETVTDIYVASATSTTVVSFATELWATGD